MARVIENCALAMSPLVLAVGSQVAPIWAAGFCAATSAATTPRAKATTTAFTIAFIEDLSDLLKKGWAKLPIIYRPALFVPPGIVNCPLQVCAGGVLDQVERAPDVGFRGV